MITIARGHDSNLAPVIVKAEHGAVQAYYEKTGVVVDLNSVFITHIYDKKEPEWREIVNLTPHTINIMTEWGFMLPVKASGRVARLSQSIEKVSEFGPVGVYKHVYGDVVDLPEQRLGTMFVVSRMIAEAIRRPDLYVVGEAIRDEEGRVIGCKGLAQI